MRTVSLDRLAERVKLAKIGYEGALEAFHGALDAARNGGVPKRGKRRGRPKGSKYRPKEAVVAAKPKHPWRGKGKKAAAMVNPATEATE